MGAGGALILFPPKDPGEVAEYVTKPGGYLELRACT